MSDTNKYCGGCAFFKHYEINPSKGECKRYPPKLVPRTIDEQDAYGDMRIRLDTFQEQPEVLCGDFCGEWRNTL